MCISEGVLVSPGLDLGFSGSFIVGDDSAMCGVVLIQYNCNSYSFCLCSCLNVCCNLYKPVVQRTFL